MITVSDHIIRLINHNDYKSKVSMGRFSTPLIKAIHEKYGIDTSGYSHVLDLSGVKHILKRHSFLQDNHRKDNIPVTFRSFDLIPEVIHNYDELRFPGKDKRGLFLVVFIKKINGHTYFIEEIRSPRKKEAALLTMYITKNLKETKPKHDLL